MRKRIPAYSTHVESTSEDYATSPLFELVGPPIYSKPESLFNHCPICKHPYASSFTSSGPITDQPVCNGAPGMVCIPTVYMAFAYPLESMQVEVERDGKTYRGVVYLVREEGQ